MTTSGITIRGRGGDRENRSTTNAGSSSSGRPKNSSSNFTNRHSRGSSSLEDDDNDDDQTTWLDDSSSTTTRAEKEGGGAGEQTAILDAAAAYMARMERVYNDDDDDKDSSSRPNHHRRRSGEQLFSDTTRNETSERGTAAVDNTQNEPSHGQDYLAPDDDDGFMDDSFYVGEEDGFRRSSSVHESDISVTDSEAYENNHHHHDDVNDGTTTTSSLSGVSSIFCTFEAALECALDDDENVDSWMRDHDEQQNNNDDDGKLLSGATMMMSPAPEAKAGTGEETVVINDSVPLPNAATTATTRDGKCDDDGRGDDGIKSTTTTLSSAKVVHHRKVLLPTTPPPSSVVLLLDAEAADDANPPSSAPDDRQRPSSITQTPPPLSSACSSNHDCAISASLKQMLHQQEHELLQMIRSIDALSSTPGRIARLCDEEMMENDDCDDDDDMVLDENDLEKNKLDDCEGGKEHERSLVTKWFTMDSNYDHRNGTSKKEKPLQEGERSRRNEENNNFAHSRSLVGEYCLDTPTSTTRTEAFMTTPARPQIPSTADASTRSEMNSPSMHYFTGTNCETNMPPPTSGTKSEPTAWLNNLRSSGMAHSSPLASHADNEPLPPNRMNYFRSSPSSTHSCVLSTPPSKPSSSSDLDKQGQALSDEEEVDAEAHRTEDVISECRMTAENDEAKQNPEFMPTDSTENKEQVLEVTDTIQKLFQDADALLQNFLASPDLVEKEMREEYCFAPSSIVVSSQAADDSHLVAESMECSDVKRENEDVVVDKWSLLQVTGHSNNEATGVKQVSVPDMVATDHIDDDERAPTVKNEDELLLSSDGAHSVQFTLAADEHQTKLSLPNDGHKVMVSNESIAESDKWVCGYAILGANAEDDPSCNANSHTPSEAKNLASATSVVNSVDDICVDTRCNFDRGNHLHANDTFDTAIGSLDCLGKDFDHFFDAKETIYDDTPARDSFGDTQSQKNNIHGIVRVAADVVHDGANCDAVETNGIDNIATEVIEPNKVPYCRNNSRDTAGGSRNFKADNRLELLRADDNSEKLTETVQTNAAHQPGDDTDFLTMDDCIRNSTAGSSSITSVKSFQKSTSSSSNGEIGVIDTPMVSISQTASNEHAVSPADQYEDESQAIDDLGVLDESIFMPNISIDAESSSLKSPDCLSTSAGLPTGMSEEQSESQLPSMRMHQKKAVGMEVLTRLAEPRHSRSTAPPVNNSSPAKSINNKAQLSAPGPPSFVSRTSSSRPRAKSTAELEREEMERMKPFKAQTIIGSSTVIRSRYKAATKLPLSSIRASAPSPSCESESKLGPPTVPKHPSFHYRRESGLCKPTPVRKKVQTFGESVQHYLNHGLRDSLPSAQIELMSTPKPPSFLRRQSFSNSAAIKSSEEIELEECQKQFRARSISFGSTPINVKRSQGRQIPVPRQHPLAQRQRALTTSSPFRLRTNLRAESNKPPLPSTDELELSKKFRALPLPSSSTRFSRRNGAIDVPCHTRAQQQYKMAKQSKETITKDVLDEYDGRFKARAVPKTTYEGMPRTETAVRMKGLTQLKPPKLSLSGRAEARKLFDQHSEEAREKENAMKQQKLLQEKEKEEEEIRMKRRSYANEGGFCFKAKPIRIEYI